MGDKLQNGSITDSRAEQREERAHLSFPWSIFFDSFIMSKDANLKPFCSACSQSPALLLWNPDHQVDLLTHLSIHARGGGVEPCPFPIVNIHPKKEREERINPRCGRCISNCEYPHKITHKPRQLPRLTNQLGAITFYHSCCFGWEGAIVMLWASTTSLVSNPSVDGFPQQSAEYLITIFC